MKQFFQKLIWIKLISQTLLLKIWMAPGFNTQLIFQYTCSKCSNNFFVAKGHFMWLLFDDQPVNTKMIETAVRISQFATGCQQYDASKLSVSTGQKHLDGATAFSCFKTKKG
jgi:hypothetical protein